LSHIILWKGLCADFSPDPVLTDDLIGKRLRKGGLKGTRTRGKCTFASTDKSQAESYTDGPGTLSQVALEAGSVVTWSPNAPDLILCFEEFLRNECWDDVSWGSWRVREIIHDVFGCVSTFETYIREYPRSTALPAIVDEYLNRISIRETVFKNHDQLAADLANHDGEVWITGPCRIIPVKDDPDAAFRYHNDDHHSALKKLAQQQKEGRSLDVAYA
jgi:hypothetical protein